MVKTDEKKSGVKGLSHSIQHRFYINNIFYFVLLHGKIGKNQIVSVWSPKILTQAPYILLTLQNLNLESWPNRISWNVRTMQQPRTILWENKAIEHKYYIYIYSSLSLYIYIYILNIKYMQKLRFQSMKFRIWNPIEGIYFFVWMYLFNASITKFSPFASRRRNVTQWDENNIHRFTEKYHFYLDKPEKEEMCVVWPAKLE